MYVPSGAHSTMELWYTYHLGNFASNKKQFQIHYRVFYSVPFIESIHVFVLYIEFNTHYY